VTPTERPSTPDCAAWPMCGREVHGHCACDVATMPVPPPSRPGAYISKRHAIAALWAECDALWEAMTESERDRAVSMLGREGDWRARR
jgi:hypothetical protein